MNRRPMPLAAKILREHARPQPGERRGQELLLIALSFLIRMGELAAPEAATLTEREARACRRDARRYSGGHRTRLLRRAERLQAAASAVRAAHTPAAKLAS